jgi:Zn-dependent peptidase ImmA (M78 family)
VEKIAKIRNVKRIFEKDIEKAGFLTPVEGGFYIFLRESDSPYKKNFSCAHEIGHTFFFDLSCRIPEQVKIKNVQQRIIEKSCDHFAESLLMPRRYFLSYWHRFETTFEFAKLEELSHQFRVSLKALVTRAMRLKALENPKRFILLFEEKANRKTGLDKKLRVSIAVMPMKSEIFVPSNISAERLGVLTLLAKRKSHELHELTTFETINTFRQEPISRHFRLSKVLCRAKYKSYGQVYLVGLFEVA